MLLLSRETNKEICIGDDIVILIANVRGNKVVVGITAPKDVTIHRREVYDRIKAKEREAARLAGE